MNPRIPDGDGDKTRDRLRPRIGKRVPREKPVSFRRGMLAQLAGSRPGRPGKQLTSPRGGPRARGNRAAFVQRPEGLSRRVVVKGHYHSMAGGGTKAARLHLGYIQRDGVGADGEAGQLYDAGGRARVDHFAEALPGEARQFRFIIAPEDGQRLDMADFTRRLMAQMETDLGRRLLWVASDHYNTDNPHSHVVLRGVDADGRPLWIDQEYFKNGLRNRARELATEVLGLRPPLELERQLQKELGQQRLTSLDRELAKHVEADLKVNLSDYPSAARERDQRARVMGRLATLEALGLARNLGGAHWQMVKGWDETLKRLGERDDIIKRLHGAVAMEPARYRSFPEATGEPVQAIEGIIRARGHHDELRGTLFAVVETADGHAHYVTLRGREQEFEVGDVVRVSSKPGTWLRPEDADLLAIAATNGGVYSREAHQRHQGDPPSLPGSPESGDDPLVAHIRRAERLGRLGILARGPAPGSWRVPPSLLEDLRRRDQANPQRWTAMRRITSLSMDRQQSLRGASWLDTIGEMDLATARGLGVELAHARAARRKFLQGLGFQPHDPALLHKLRRLEREDLARQLSTSGRARIVGAPAAVRHRFRGQLEPPQVLPSGQRVSVVQDAERNRFMVLPYSRDHANRAGNTVEVGRGPDGRIRLRDVAPRDRGHDV